MTSILVTGAEGFLGTHLCPALAARGYEVVRSTRKEPPRFAGVDTVVHLAAIAHQRAPDDIIDFNNNFLAVQLARNAQSAGVKRFIFVSSIAAQSGSSCAHVLTEASEPKPATSYGRAKLSAERGIAKVGLPFDILRPVVTDGLGAKGNFGALRKIAALPVPLPFGALRSRRSILSVENFNSAVLAVLRTEPSNSAYIAANPQPMTLGEIVSYIRAESGRRPNLFPLPEPLVGLTCRAVGRGDLWERIGKPLIASPAKLLSIGWQPT